MEGAVEGAGERAVPSVTQRGWKERPSGLGRAAPLLRVSPASSGKSGGLEPGAPRGRVQLYSSVFLCKDTFIDESFPSFFKNRAS